MKIYLARPITGKSYDEVMQYLKDLKEELEIYGYKVLSPMTGKGCLKGEKKFKAFGYKDAVTTNHAIVERDRWMVENADIVFVNFENTDKVSIGCVAELAWAHQLGKHTVVVLPKDNIHEHAFVLEMADIVFRNFEDAVSYLKELNI